MTDVTIPNFTDELIEKFQAKADDSSGTVVKINKADFLAFLESAKKFRGDAVMEILNRQQEIEGLVKQVELAEKEVKETFGAVKAIGDDLDDMDKQFMWLNEEVTRILAGLHIFNGYKKAKELEALFEKNLSQTWVMQVYCRNSQAKPRIKN